MCRTKILDLGILPDYNSIPEKMHAWTIRKERFGEPINSFKHEVVSVPNIGPKDVLVYNMVAGFNYNGLWASLGKPQDVVSNHGRYDKENNVDFHICGSESSAIVVSVGQDVTSVKVGDEVIVLGNQYDTNCPLIKAGKDPVLSPTQRIWGYEANWGAFAQYSKVQEIQCVPKPKSLDWIESATIGATGITAYKMLVGWKGNKIKKGDVVLIWGASGGLGSMAIQLVNYFGGIPVAVVSSKKRAEICMKLGAAGCINRLDYSHWNALDDDYLDQDTQKEWLKGALKFRRAIWKIVGKKQSPQIVFEHVGKDTLPTSLFVCDSGGMVVICGGTTGYTGTLDLRYLWLSQKRLQGSHAGTVKEYYELCKIIESSSVRPYISHVYEFEEIGAVHQLMYENMQLVGKLAVRIGLSNGTQYKEEVCE